MALTSEQTAEVEVATVVADAASAEVKEDKEQEMQEDLEDGEIEDDDDEELEANKAVAEPNGAAKEAVASPPPAVALKESPKEPAKHGRGEERRNSNNQKKKHLTEAEKSVMKLHKLERLEREKREKFRREQFLATHSPAEEDDFATSLEKAIAKVLKKDGSGGGKEMDDGSIGSPAAQGGAGGGRKRKKKDKHRKGKRARADSPKASTSFKGGDDLEKSEIPANNRADNAQSDESSSSSTSEDVKRPKRNKKNNYDRRKYRERSRDRSNASSNDKRPSNNNNNGNNNNNKNKRNVGICLYYLQGKCNDDNCQYSHDCVQPLKLELCKFYLLDCCAKGDKCLYMHSEFPCKYYHTGLPCPYVEKCKFAHGAPLKDSVRQILFKHIETAPKEILGNFPRFSRENAQMMIAQAQKNLELKYGKKEEEKSNGDLLSDTNAEQSDESSQKEKKEKRSRPSRWQDPEPEAAAFKTTIPPPAFKDQDMRFANPATTSNGDVDMRAAVLHPTHLVNPNILASAAPSAAAAASLGNILNLPNLIFPQGLMLNPAILQSALQSGPGIFNTPPPEIKVEPKKECEIDALLSSKQDTDIRMDLPPIDTDIRLLTTKLPVDNTPDEEDNALQIVMDEEEEYQLPKTQKQLFDRIQSQQKNNVPDSAAAAAAAAATDNATEEAVKQLQEVQDWYSDDEDDNKLTIEQEEDAPADLSNEQLKPQDFADDKADEQIKQIDISAEVSKLFNAIKSKPLDPRLNKEPPVTVAMPPTLNSAKEATKGVEQRDPRLARRSVSVEEKVSIYESSNLQMRGDETRKDTDLRLLSLNKGMENYTPAMEIDASIASHPPMTWRVYIVEIPRPDYSGLKLSATDNNGDPRLKKIFSSCVDDSPASPPPMTAAPISSPPKVRLDPRRKKEEPNAMTYAQQMATLQASPFYQSLTSNQKLMLNQELANRNDQSGGIADPILSAMLQTVSGSAAVMTTPQQSGQALTSILSALNVANQQQATGPHLAVPPGGPGLLGPAPDQYFDPRAAGLLGPPPFGQPPPGNFNPIMDVHHVQQQQQQPPPFYEEFYDGAVAFNANSADAMDGRGFREQRAQPAVQQQQQQQSQQRNRGRNNNGQRNRNNFFRRNNNRSRNSPS